MDLYVRMGRRYRPATAEQVREVAAAYQLDQFPQGTVIRSPMDAKALVASQLSGLESEHFGAGRGPGSSLDDGGSLRAGVSPLPRRARLRFRLTTSLAGC